MTNEELLLSKMENLENQIAPLVKTVKDINELKSDMIPLGNQAVGLMIKELQEVEAGFQLEDLFLLSKEMMRNIRSFTFAIKQMNNIIEFAQDIEPLMKTAVPQLIQYLDQLEQKGVFRMMNAMIDIRTKVASAYDADDIEQIGDTLVTLLGLAKKLSDPAAIAFLEKAAALPASVDIENCKEVGAFGMMAAGFNSEIKQGLGVLMELTKAMGKMKGNGSGHGESPA